MMSNIHSSAHRPTPQWEAHCRHRRMVRYGLYYAVALYDYDGIVAIQQGRGEVQRARGAGAWAIPANAAATRATTTRATTTRDGAFMGPYLRVQLRIQCWENLRVIMPPPRE